AVWGMAWFLIASAALAETFPMWSSYRCVFASFGLGLALAAPLAAASPALLAPLAALQLALFAVSPAAPRNVAPVPIEVGEFDYRHFVRLERMVRETRSALLRRYPRLPHRAMVGQHNLPLMSEYVFAGSNALQVWYRDSTLSWIRFDRFRSERDAPVAAFVEYQPTGAPQFVLVDVAAMRGLISASERIRDSQWERGLAALDSAEAAQRDTMARV